MAATHRITAPVQGLNTVGVGGLQFTNSVAETDNPAIIDYCQSSGYKVESVRKAPAKKAAPKTPSVKPTPTDDPADSKIVDGVITKKA